VTGRSEHVALGTAALKVRRGLSVSVIGTECSSTSESCSNDAVSARQAPAVRGALWGKEKGRDVKYKAVLSAE